MTLTDFILARIADDEAAVYAWDSDGAAQVASMWTGPEPGYATVASGRPASGWFADGREVEDARHVEVLYNPARVLAECEAKRQIVELHKSWPVLVKTPPKFSADTGDPTSLTMRMSQQVMWATEQEYRERFGSEPPTAPMLRVLAAVYADHPDYDESWRP